MHGYQIANSIQRISDDVLQVEEGSLYPALQRMLIKGWVTAKWGVTAGNRRARYYALLAYNVSQQSREIGIRMALGALPKQILALVLQSGARLALFGVVVGIAAGIIVTRLMTRLLYQVSASNPFVFGGAAAALLACALLACYVPAWRATRVDPLAALRDE